MRTHRIAVAAVLAVVVGTFAVGAKRRSVRSGRCLAPTLTLSVSPQVACPTAAVIVSWRATNSKAVVTIEGIGDHLRSSGSARVTDGRRTFTGYASNACARGTNASATVSSPEPPFASISGPSSVRQFNTATLRVDVSDESSWSLSSPLLNSITPDSGIGSEEATYHASKAGTDGVLLSVTGECEMTTQRTLTIVVEPGSQPPPPPPPPLGLRCCDGTRSPSCTSCNDLRGCCSGHGGVCDCGRS